MRKFTVLWALLTLAFCTGRAQVYFYDDFQALSVNNYSVADLGDGWVLYNDDNEPTTDLVYFDDAWKIYQDEDGAMAAASLSFFRNENPADRWMVSPVIDLTKAKRPYLYFRAKSMDNERRDDLEVKISTKGTDKEDFTETVQQIKRCKTSWNEYFIDLSAYKGQKVYLAFVENSTDRYIVCVDDVWVGEKADIGALPAGIACADAAHVNQYPYTLKVKLNVVNTGNDAVTSCVLAYRLNNGPKETKEFTGLNIAPGTGAAAEFAVALNENGNHRLKVEVESVNGKKAAAPATSAGCFTFLNKDLPHKAAVFEIFSSGMCSACGPWNKALHPVWEALHANEEGNPGNLVVAKYQVNVPATGDQLVTEETEARRKLFGIEEAPTFYFNGTPYAMNAENYQTDVPARVNACKNQKVNLGLNASITRNDNVFTINAHVTTYYPDKNGYSLVVCFVEDSVHLAAASQITKENDFYYVVRKMMGGARGYNFFPAPAGQRISQEYTYMFDKMLPWVHSLDNINAVVYVQNNLTREIVQGKYLKVGAKDEPPVLDFGAGNEDEIALPADELKLYPNPAKGGYVKLNMVTPRAQSTVISVFNMAGAQIYARKWNVAAGENLAEISTSGWNAGTYMVAVTSERGMMVKKLIVR